jgi:acyl transferase domain-containing protein/thioesterase domain-containing protein/acyl carrier protein
MSDLAERVAGLSPAQRKLLEQRLKRQPAAAQPIAIIGMGCRFPGAADLPSFWRLIREGRSAAREVPPDRWNVDAFYDPSGETAGKMSVRWAAFIDDPDKFDPQFFGITPREAARIDPQQRLLLEVAWETMENAGRPADELAGSRTAVFVGIGGNDYSKVPLSYDDYYQHIDAHMGTGNALSIAANRLSYIFDFHGPSAAVDTACSSSSLAIHMAVESLRRGESDAALAGGVNLILTPETTIAFSKARMLSPDGVCRPFDSKANGYVRGEGCGLVLLKRLADAERDGDQILGILRGTSVNQDGRTSGISAPNSQLQAACIRAAQQQAGVKPEDISYIEAHGTGTPLGDPIEMQSLCEIFQATGDKAPPCYVTSVKANVGHMETVSGVAGLIKVALMMQHEDIVPQAHFVELNPHIKLENTRLVIPREATAWPRADRSRVAGISSFGFGGTNTHMIVESPSQTRAAGIPVAEATSPASRERPIHLLKLSAKNEAALAHSAAQLADYLEGQLDANLADVCWSANTGRADFNHRAVIVAVDSDQLRQRLKSVAAGTTTSGVKQAVVRTLGRPNVAFLFTGQGSQYVGMGRGLYESQPVFRAALGECDAILRDIWNGESLLDVLYPVAKATSPASSSRDCDARLHQTRYTQPALFALEYALAELWASWGVSPDIVLGHSVGEFAAACVAGVMSLEDSLALIAERARLMQNVQRRGKMAVVFAAQERVARQIAETSGDVVVAVINGPENTVISGDAAAVDAVAAKFQADGVQAKMLNVSHAFHSPLMEEMLDEFERFAARFEYASPQIPLAANLTGQLMTTAPTAQYWRDHLRNTVQFAAGMERIAEANPTTIIEIGPTTSLLGMGRRCVPGLDAAWLPSLRDGQDEWPIIAASVGEYYVRGGRVDWRGWDQPWRRSRMWLPNYPFQRARHWFTFEPSRWRGFGGDSAPAVGVAAGEKGTHPLLGTPLSTVWSNSLFESRLSARSPAYLVDHQVQGSAVTPAAAYLEQALTAADKVFGAGKHGIAHLVIQQAMFLPEDVSRRVQVSVSPETGGEATFETYSRPTSEATGQSAAWTMHATGQLVHESKSVTDFHSVGLAAAWGRACKLVSKEDFYASMAERGLAYGPAFQVLAEMGRGTDDAVARIELPESVRREASQYHLHPALGDALLQSMAGAVPLEEDGSFSPYTYMPVGIRRVRILVAVEDVTQTLFAYTLRTSEDSGPSPERVEANVFLTDGDGRVLVGLEGVQVQRVGRAAGAESTRDTSEWLYQVAWREKPLAVNAPNADGQAATQSKAGAWLIFVDSRGVARQLADQLAKTGAISVLVERGNVFQFTGHDEGNGHATHHASAAIDPLDESHYAQLIEAAFGRSGRACSGIVHLSSLDIRERSAGAAQHDRDELALGCGSALLLVRALSRANLTKQPPLWLITAGAQAVSGDGMVDAIPISVQQSALLGFGRVAAMELPDLRPRLVDLDAGQLSRNVDAAVSALVDELSAANDGEVAYRQGKRFVARLERNPSLIAEAGKDEGAALTIPSGKFQLRITQPGSFDALRFAAVGEQPPGPGQVEIEVRATGLNFSDVLKALGLYPGIKDAIVPLGIEASGVVTAVGEGVERFTVGDEVFGVVPYAFASHARTAEYALVHKPKSIDHDAACTIPITFLTAYYGLVRLADLQRGERVLIHAGAGGVGLAAIQIAQQIGAEIFATAGSDAKREFLRSLGVKHVYSSRSTAFADEMLADTNREGIDVVLNSLPGEVITKSLAILRAYGRFLEIGKTDIYQNRMIGLLPFQDNLSYHAIDLDRLLRQRPDYVRGLFADVMRQFEARHYQPLMFTRFEAAGTIDAFRYMSQRKNIGKVVVSMESRESRIDGREPENGRESRVEGREQEKLSMIGAIARSDGTYLITGGLGALGLRVAEWLAEQGAGTVALLSRRGASAEVESALDTVRQKGAGVVVLRCDVTDFESLAGALEQIRDQCPPLRGVVHAAGVLADGIITDMTLEQLDRAMLPKIAGAWNLHTATLDEPLDFFVMFSSVASVLGSPGQANYAAGNAYLDALAHARRRQGRPAASINWGPWAGSGMAVEVGRGDAIKSRGMSLIDPEEGLDLLGRLTRTGAAQVAVMDAEWADMLRLLGPRRPALLEDIAAEVGQAGGESTGSRVDHAFRQQLFATDETTRRSLVADYIRMELARIMGIEAASLEMNQPLSTFGLDSLLALELKNNLETRLDFTLPMAKLMEGPSIASLAEETARLIVAGESGGTVGDDEKPSADAADKWTPLFALRSGGDRPPLVLLPPLGGDVSCYADLLQELGADQPVYAFRPRGVDQDLPPHLTMDETISDYLAALRKLQPSGPYYLAAWSTGGIFAYALAEALERAGEKVELLALFDTPLPSICDDVEVDDDTRFFCKLLNFANLSSGKTIEFSYEEMSRLAPDEQFRTALADARQCGMIPMETPEAYVRRLVHVGEANVRAIQSYKPQPLFVPIELFVPVQKGALKELSGREPSADEDHGWLCEVGGTVNLHSVPGDHFNMMAGQGAAYIAQQLQELLAARVVDSLV